MKDVRRRFGIGFGILTGNNHITVYFNTSFYDFGFYWNQKCKGVRLYKYHNLLNDECYCNNRWDASKLFIGIMING